MKCLIVGLRAETNKVVQTHCRYLHRVSLHLCQTDELQRQHSAGGLGADWPAASFTKPHDRLTYFLFRCNASDGLGGSAVWSIGECPQSTILRIMLPVRIRKVLIMIALLTAPFEVANQVTEHIAYPKACSLDLGCMAVLTYGSAHTHAC